MKLSRNAPCPCGSGRKFKNCCIGRLDAEDSLWRKVHSASEALTVELMRFAKAAMPPEVFEDAVTAFLAGMGEEDDLDKEQQLFIPWLLFHFDPFHFGNPGRGTVARRFLEGSKAPLDPLDVEILEAALAGEFRFWRVAGSVPGRSLTLAEVGGERTVTILERSGSALPVGAILFGKVVEIRGLPLLDGCGSTPIPASSELTVVAALEEIRSRRRERTKLPDVESHLLRGGYLKLARAVRSAGRPSIVNTDGDPVLFHEQDFAIDSAEAAFEALAPLSSSPAGCRDAAERDAAGRIVKAEVDWSVAPPKETSPMPHVAIATFEIDGTRMTARTNSAARAERVAEKIEELLGGSARLRGTRVDPLDRPRAVPSPEERARAREEQERLRDDPEVREMVRGILLDHARSWVDESIPALDGVTPRAAMKSGAGRKKVEILVRQMEDHDPIGDGGPREDVAWIRKELGLSKG
jgi:hypothetical protein